MCLAQPPFNQRLSRSLVNALSSKGSREGLSSTPSQPETLEGVLSTPSHGHHVVGRNTSPTARLLCQTRRPSAQACLNTAQASNDEKGVDRDTFPTCWPTQSRQRRLPGTGSPRESARRERGHSRQCCRWRCCCWLLQPSPLPRPKHSAPAAATAAVPLPRLQMAAGRSHCKVAGRAVC